MRKKVVITNGKKLTRPPKSEKEQNELADLLVTWSYSEPAINIADFPLSYSYSPYRFYKIAENNEYFSDALNLARENIGSRLLRKVDNGEMDKDVAFKLLPMYSREYKEFLMAKIKADVQTRMAVNVVEIPAIPNCDSVPLRTINSNNQRN